MRTKLIRDKAKDKAFKNSRDSERKTSYEFALRLKFKKYWESWDVVN